MILINGDLVEVVAIDSGSKKLVNVNFYNRNRDRLVPMDEYYIRGIDNSMTINQERVNQALALRVPKVVEETLDALEEFKEAPVLKVKQARAKRTTKSKK